MSQHVKLYVRPLNGKRVLAFSMGDARKLAAKFGEGAKIISVPATR